MSTLTISVNKDKADKQAVITAILTNLAKKEPELAARLQPDDIEKIMMAAGEVVKTQPGFEISADAAFLRQKKIQQKTMKQRLSDLVEESKRNPPQLKGDK